MLKSHNAHEAMLYTQLYRVIIGWGDRGDELLHVKIISIKVAENERYEKTKL